MTQLEIEQVIINNLKDQINVIANQSFPVDEFHGYAYAVLQEICHECVGNHTLFALERIQEIVFERTTTKSSSDGGKSSKRPSNWNGARSGNVTR